MKHLWLTCFRTDRFKIRGMLAFCLSLGFSLIARAQDFAGADHTARQPVFNLAEFESDIAPILKNACEDCHGPDTQEAGFRLDTLDPDLVNGKDASWWIEVYGVIGKSEMPPSDASELSEADREKLVQWLSSQLHTASILRRRSERNSTFRRLTRYEFNYAMQDLLKLPWDFARDLPPEANSEDGFQNSRQSLHVSVSQLETMHRLARAALNRATVKGTQPPTLTWGITMKDVSKLEWPKQEQQLAKMKKDLKDDPIKLQEEIARIEDSFQQPHPRTYFRDIATGKTVLAAWDYTGAKYANLPIADMAQLPDGVEHVAILPAGNWLNIELGNQLPDEGTLRVRVRASRTSSESGRTPSLQLDFGWQASNEGRALLRVSQADALIQAAPGRPEFYQWDIPLGEIYPRNSVRSTWPMGATPSPSEYIRLVNSSASPDEILIDYVQVLAPVYDQWPPASHRNIFPIEVETAQRDASDKENSTGRLQHARQIISGFMKRAWRRPVSEAEQDQKMKLFEDLLPECESFEEAVIEVLATVIASPQFLYVVQESGVQDDSSKTSDANISPDSRITDYELAMRLSLFLWSSIPDDHLLELASSASLSEPSVLAKQVQRMLDDPRSGRLAQHFVYQWLNMEPLDFLNFSQHVPHFDPLLKEAMQREPVALFDEMLKNNENVLGLIHSNFTMANQRLANHYGIPGVAGNHFRRVALDGSFRRGGLLTQAGLLAMNSDYPDSHPLKRGKWLLESLLNDPPPPPPPAVPQIDLANPEIAKMTLKERIEDHRNQAACRSCHAKIDPWGIAFENYDALGQWRDEVQGKPVDANSELFNRQTLAGMEGLKRYLLEHRQDQFVAAVVYKLSTYALGRPLGFADFADLDAITNQVRRDGDGLRTLVTLVVTSQLYQSK